MFIDVYDVFIYIYIRFKERKGAAGVDTKLLTTEEAGEYCRVKPQTVRLWIRDGKLPALRAGGHYRIKQVDLDAFLQRDIK